MTAQPEARIEPRDPQPRRGASQVTQRVTKTSPKAKGHITGACYLAIFVAGVIYSSLIPHTLLLDNNDVATINHIVLHQTAFWVGYPFFLLVVALRLIVMLLFYELFKPVNKSLSLLAVYFNILATSVQAVMCIFLLTPLLLLGGEHSLTAFTPDQLHALALVAMKLYHLCYSIALAFFGCYDLLIGYLAFKSPFIPRPIGVLMGITGLGWLTFFIPPVAAFLLPYNSIVGFIGESSMILWLCILGVNSEQWYEQASKASEPDSRAQERAAG
jgi:hypothetical protein